MSLDNYVDQLVLRRDGTVATVTGHSGGWLLLDGDVDDSALPNEVMMLSLNCEDHIIVDMAMAFGIDVLAAQRVPDLARKAIVQAENRYCALQTIPHPTIDKAYLTILGSDTVGRYRVSVKPEKGSSYELQLTEKSIEVFEMKGTLPMAEAKVNWQIGDVVMLADKVIQLKSQTDTDWTYLDVDTHQEGQCTVDAPLTALPKVVQDTIRFGIEYRERNEEYKKQDAHVDSLLANVSVLEKENDTLKSQLEQAKSASRSDQLQKLQTELDQERSNHHTTQDALTNLAEQYATLQESAAKEHLEVMELRKKVTAPAPVASPEPTKAYEAKIILSTGEADLERMWNTDWTLYHSQFVGETLKTVWKKFNKLDDTPDEPKKAITAVSPDDDTEDIIVPIVPIADVGFKSVDAPIVVPEAIPQSNNNLPVGRIGKALMAHGVDAVTGALDAEVTLAGHFARQDDVPIKQFLPEGVVTS